MKIEDIKTEEIRTGEEVTGKVDRGLVKKAEHAFTKVGHEVKEAITKGMSSVAETAENVAERWGVSREDQDGFALRSQRRWAAADTAGRFRDELVAVGEAVRDEPLGRLEVPDRAAGFGIDAAVRLAPDIEA